jgi:glycosyltransferase involved in cell wall biosynthesis
MRIILNTHLFLPEFSGGTETLVHGVATALTQKGHSVLVLTGWDDKDPLEADDQFDEYILDSIRVVRFKRGFKSTGNHGNPMRNDYDNHDYEKGFLQLLNEFKPDVVHFHHFGRSSIKTIDACHHLRIPTFLTVTDYWSICPQQALLLPDGKICDGPVMGNANCLKHMVELTQPKWLSAAVDAVPNRALGVLMGTLKRSDIALPGILGVTQALAKRSATIAKRFQLLTKILVPTQHAQSTLERNGIIADKFRILPFGLKDHGYTKRVRQRNSDPLVIGYIGQFLPHKGLHVLMEALRLLPLDFPVILKVYAKLPANGSPYVDDLLAQIQADSRVVFEGTFANETIPEVLDKIDVLVIPSIWHENMPLVSLSAQAAGCPVIASDVNGLSDVVSHGVNGLLFKPGKAEDLRDCISQLISDENKLQQLSRAAKTPCSLNQYVDDLEAEYQQAVGEKK